MSTETLDARATVDAFRSGERSAVELAQQALEAAERDRLGAFWHVLGERASQRAAELDELRARDGSLGPLAGVPFAAKDCFDVAGVPTSCGIGGDPVLAIPTRDAAAVARLEDAGAILIAKTSMDQLAWGMKGDPLGFPPIRNPADPTRMAGGSSGGSAAGVGSGVVPLSLGTDAGGSVRQPAAWCGVVGFKPRLGSISTAGCAPMAPSLDTVGIFSRTVADQELVASTLRGPGAVDASEAPVAPRVGVLTDSFSEVDPAVAERCEAALRAWEASGATLVDLELPWVRRGLGRIYAAELAASWVETLDPADERLLPTVRDGLAYGARVDAVSYISAVQNLSRVRDEAVMAIADVDVVAGPTSPIVAPPLSDPDPTEVAGRNTRVFNGLGWPAVSVPLAAPELPVGLQLAAGPDDGERLLSMACTLADALEQ